MTEPIELRPMTERIHDVDTENFALFVLAVVFSLLQFGAAPLLFGASRSLDLALLVAIVVATSLHRGLAHESHVIGMP